MAKGEFRFSPFAIPLKTTKKGVATPFLDFSQEFDLCKAHFKPLKNAMQLRIRQSGEVVEILCVCLDFHTSNIQRALTSRLYTVFRALRKLDSTVARRAFGLRKEERKTHQVTNCFFARKRYFVPSASFLHTFFWQDRKKYARGATVAVAQKSRHCGAIAKSLPHPPDAAFQRRFAPLSFSFPLCYNVFE